MDVLLLGTGASDGVPNAWCGCATCAEARASGSIRTNNSALIDGRLLIDCGPEAPRQAQRAGLELSGVRTVLIGHAHDDHLDPAFLMHRGWVSEVPLQVVGPAPAIARCTDWLAPDQSVVTFTTVTAGDELMLDGYRARVLPATHHALGEAVLYAIEAPDGRHLLYATDTGPWRSALLTAVTGTRFDLVLLEETFGDAEPPNGVHHCFTTFAAAVDDLRSIGAVDDRTRVVAVHVGHNNPTHDELVRRLAELGAEVHPDLTLLRV
ncbi:MBL fold metallo-hydrolase [Micropruina sonneratiae]|uniref:MBL fold metallo-hydrolase n=1 Tax=Micropruina sonneratiae TaxID=2986940 RepID=UPI002227DDE5|nr:MBL fold metallo-hydrolase [Micropruina sp. KQZ13P-5]MCW3156790.1 MBL fold metallo-hydrolase [Micropruina sp. KQZ13P-5]